jgi:hypothetical protein
VLVPVGIGAGEEEHREILAGKKINVSVILVGTETNLIEASRFPSD